jgi:hypothetical protein
MAGGLIVGVEYRHYLMPASRPFRPDASQTVGLIEALRAGRWIADPASPSFKKMKFQTTHAAEHAKKCGAFAVTVRNKPFPLPSPLAADSLAKVIAGDAVLTWPVERMGDAKLEYPFDIDPVDPEAYYELQLHFSQDYVHHSSEIIEPLEGLECCGEALEINLGDDDVFYSSRIRATCPGCKRPFDPSKKSVNTQDMWTGEPGALRGGGAYRFAIVVDCGKFIPGSDKAVPLRRQFKALCEKTLGQKLVDVGDMY